MTTIVKLLDSSGDPEYDTLFLAPESMTSNDAVDLINRAVVRVREAHGYEREFEDLMDELTPLGFKVIYPDVCAEEW